MADTFSLRFEIDASRAEAGAKKFTTAINNVTKSLDGLDAKGEAAFSKLMGASTGNFSKLAKDLGKLNDVKINPAAVKNINSLGTAFRNLKAPSPALIKNITNFATVIPALLNSFNVSGNFADSVNKISTALNGLKIPSAKKLEGLRTFADGLKAIAPSLKIVGNFGNIEKLGTAMGAFRAPSEKAVANMRAFFNALNNSGAKASISGSLVSGIVNLSSAMGGLKSPSGTAVKNLRDLFATLATFKPVSGTSSIANITAAFSGFKGPTAAQTKNLRDFVTMLGSLKVPANVGQIASYLERIGQAATRANGYLHNFRSNLNGIGFGNVSQGAQGLTTNLRGLENAFSGTFQAASVFRTLIGSITLGTLSKALYDANTNFNAFKSTLLAVNNGDLKATGEEMRYTEDMANRLGQRVQDIQESFGSFSISSRLAGVSTEQTRSVFEATITAMTVLHRSSDRTKLALLALEQMMSKGTVSSEELRRQLGEQLPGAVNLMARGLKVSTGELQDMLKKGQVLAADALPKFAAEVQRTFGGSLQSALKNATAQFNLLQNAVYDLFIIIGQSGTMDALSKAFERIKNAISAPEFLTFASQFGERTARVIEGMGTVFAGLIKNIDLVIGGLKVLLALNIARFFTSFGAMLLGNIANMTAWGGALTNLRILFTGLAPAAAGAATAVGFFGRAAAAASLLAGPIGLVVTTLGILGAAWYASSQKGQEFTTVVDTSKESLDRYQDSLQTLTMAQLVLEQEKLATTLKDLQTKISETRTEYQSLLTNAPSGRRWVEVQELADQLKNVKVYLDDTGKTYDQFIRELGAKKFDTKQADQLRDAYLRAQNAVAMYGKESAYAQEQVQRLNAVMNGTTADSFAGEMAQAGNAAAGMAEAVANAANKVVEANARMNLSKAQTLLADEFIGAAKSRVDALKEIADEEGSLSDKRELNADINKRYDLTLKNLNSSANELLGINDKMDTKKSAQNYVEKFGSDADETSRKLSKLKEDISGVKSLTDITDSQRNNTIKGLQDEYDSWVKSQEKSKGGGGGSGGALGKLLDSDGKATVQFRKEQELLEKALSKGKITQDQYNGAMENLKAKYAGTTAGLQGFNAEFEALRNELMPSNSGLTDFINKQALLQQALDTGKIKLSEYTDLMLRLRKANAEAASGGSGNNFIDGINKGLLDLTKTGEDFTTDIAGVVSNAFGGLEDALTEWVSTGKLDFKALTESILSDISRLVIRYMVIQPIIQALSGMMGGGSGGGLLGGLLGGGNSGTSFFPSAPTGGLYANGAAFNSGKVVPFAKGGLTNSSNSGIVASPTYFEMSGNKTGLMGEAGPEAIMPLRRGPDGSLGVAASGAAQASTNVVVQPRVNVNITGGSGNAEVESKQNPDGSLDINVLLEQVKSAVASDVSKGGTPLNRAFETRYGASAAAGNKR
jgi:lambda family phage tail tape measure protein